MLDSDTHCCEGMDIENDPMSEFVENRFAIVIGRSEVWDFVGSLRKVLGKTERGNRVRRSVSLPSEDAIGSNISH